MTIDLETVGRIAVVAVNMVIAGYAAWHFAQWALGAVCWRWKRHRLPHRTRMEGSFGYGDVYAFRSKVEQEAFCAGWQEALRGVVRQASKEDGIDIHISGLPPDRSDYLLTAGAADEAPPDGATIH